MSRVSYSPLGIIGNTEFYADLSALIVVQKHQGLAVRMLKSLKDCKYFALSSRPTTIFLCLEIGLYILAYGLKTIVKFSV